MHYHALATTKPSKNNACFFYYYYLQGGHNHFVFGIEWLPNPPPKHSVTFELRCCKFRFDIKTFFSIFRASIYFTHRFKRCKYMETSPEMADWEK